MQRLTQDILSFLSESISDEVNLINRERINVRIAESTDFKTACRELGIPLPVIQHYASVLTGTVIVETENTDKASLIYHLLGNYAIDNKSVFHNGIAGISSNTPSGVPHFNQDYPAIVCGTSTIDCAAKFRYTRDKWARSTDDERDEWRGHLLATLPLDEVHNFDKLVNSTTDEEIPNSYFCEGCSRTKYLVKVFYYHPGIEALEESVWNLI